MTNVTKIFFSPSGTTKQVVNQIASAFEGDGDEFDLINFNSAKEFGEDDLVIVGLPIFAGRLPKTASERLKKVKGNNTPAIAITNYGNANIGDALLELGEILVENNFKVIGAATTISHHSIFSNVAVGRPDDTDIAKIDDFAQKCKEKLESGATDTIEIPGEKQGIELKQLPFIVSSDETLCSFCYDCVNVCPENAIPDDDPIDTDLDLCSRCTACISICPEDARSFTGEAFEAKKPVFEEANSERKEPEFYL